MTHEELGMIFMKQIGDINTDVLSYRLIDSTDEENPVSTDMTHSKNDPLTNLFYVFGNNVSFQGYTDDGYYPIFIKG